MEEFEAEQAARKATREAATRVRGDARRKRAAASARPAGAGRGRAERARVGSRTEFIHATLRLGRRLLGGMPTLASGLFVLDVHIPPEAERDDGGGKTRRRQPPPGRRVRGRSASAAPRCRSRRHPPRLARWPPARCRGPSRHVAISSMSFSAGAAGPWQRQTSGEWPGEPEATLPRPEHGFRDSATYPRGTAGSRRSSGTRYFALAVAAAARAAVGGRRVGAVVAAPRGTRTARRRRAAADGRGRGITGSRGARTGPEKPRSHAHAWPWHGRGPSTAASSSSGRSWARGRRAPSKLAQPSRRGRAADAAVAVDALAAERRMRARPRRPRHASP